MAPSSFRRPVRRAPDFRHSPRRIAPRIGISFAGLLLGHAALAGGVLPQGGHYTAGAGTIASQGAALVVTQPGSTRGVIDWNSFSIGKGNTVTFDNDGGATLNRVTGSSPSALLGNLNATGSVYLINPQGIVVGRSGVISTGGRFVASTLDLPNSAFLNGGTLTLAGTSSGKVVNLGKISSTGGDVFLIAHDAVVNAGSVSAQNGTAEYVTGQQVVLYESSNSRQVFVQISSKGTVVDRGITQAAQIKLEAADGNIYALAGSGSRIRATGTAMRDGHIWLVAGDGHVMQQGTLDATNADGRGGTVDTLANSLTLASDATVRAGSWNVSTPNFTVDNAAAGAFVRSLNAGTTVDATATGTNGASGDMTVASNLSWQGPASLSLVAFRNVTIAPATTIKNTGSGNLSLRADAASIDNAGGVANHGTIDWSDSTGFVSSLYDMNGSYAAGNSLSNQAWTAPPDSALVTQVTAYKLVNSLTDLEDVGLDLSGTYALGRDVNAQPPSGSANAPIGSFPSHPFTGQFDGMGHTISNLEIVDSSSEIHPGVGLFSEIGTAGVVRNLSVQGSISGSSSLNGGDYGVLAGINDGGTIASVHTSGKVITASGNSVGGLVGWSNGAIRRSSSNADVQSGASFTGGLVGYNAAVISQSFASGSVTGSEIGVGGLVGVNANTITQSYSTGPVTVPVQCFCAGALVGQNLYSVIEQSFATGRVQAPGGGGGIAGYNLGPVSIASDVYWDTQTTGASVAVLGVAGNSQPGNARGLTTAQMSVPSSFGPTYDFSPNGVWLIPSGGTHPVLRWQLAH
ncbi:filamentous hemagglutinin family protein [Paraburkholderia sp. GV068]|uniref:two-partner secretion domain-containing protein n=1 Tax=Paraburkholderia TaxID=1822464 RepID=UPI000D2FF32B|nr:MULTISPECIES: filamentous hemagglutinin N-terminal domain-containing protein [unclassified Paraburkholderia]PTQ99126.1 filamentous hemagglutinin family protein [Paraburkholderia sp. GV072]PUB04618.1 filamentous hemagglutinin family protein [Paraburkholderia sp. GV068]